MAIDPVCGMAIETERAGATRSLRGHTLYFCSSRCVAKFDQNPAAFRERGLDPVCGMDVDVERAVGVRVVNERAFCFCSTACLESYDRDPRAFARRAEELEQARSPWGRDE